METLLRLPVMIGILLLAGGFVTIINSIFSLRIPVGKIVFALILIWIGVWLIARPSKKMADKRIAEHIEEQTRTFEFQKKRYRLPEDALIKDSSYRVSFGSLMLDLRGGIPQDERTVVYIDANFGEVTILVDETLPAKFVADTSFGEVVVFGQQSGGITGNVAYETSGFREAKKKVEFHISSAFAGVRVAKEDPNLGTELNSIEETQQTAEESY